LVKDDVFKVEIDKALKKIPPGKLVVLKEEEIEKEG
jgi:hypothetical protein